MQPMRWQDGRPVIGVDEDGTGIPVSAWPDMLVSWMRSGTREH